MMCRGWGNGTKIYLVEAAIAPIKNQLNGHVGTVSNTTNSGVGEIEWNTKAASPRGAGKVAGKLLSSGRISEVVE